MGSRGPMPTKTAKRRNKETRPHEINPTPPTGHPKLPATYRTTDGTTTRFLKDTRQAWRTWWSHQLSSDYQTNTHPGMLVVAVLYDRALRGEKVHADLKAWMKEYGLTWDSQQRARLVFKDQTATEEPEPVKTDDERRSRVKAVAG